MAWLRVDDTALTHPKVIRLRALGHQPVAVIGFVMLAATWSGQHLTDCFVPAGLGPLVDERWQELAAAALAVGMLTDHTDEHGQAGWLVVIGDGLFHLMSKAEVLLNREKRNGSRRIQTKVAILLRDGDLCRYCGHTVSEHDHRSAYGRQIEHVDPRDPHTPMVVSCKACNERKGARTPEEAGLELLPPPDPDRLFWQPSTLVWLTKYDADPRPGTQPGTAHQKGSTSPVEPSAIPQPAGHRPSASPPAVPTPTATRGRERPEKTRPDPNPPAPAMPLGRDGPERVGSGGARSGRVTVGSPQPVPRAPADVVTRQPSRKRGSSGRGRRGGGSR